MGGFLRFLGFCKWLIDKGLVFDVFPHLPGVHLEGAGKKNALR
jgi:hypothetical protein